MSKLVKIGEVSKYKEQFTNFLSLKTLRGAKNRMFGSDSRDFLTSDHTWDLVDGIVVDFTINLCVEKLISVGRYIKKQGRDEGDEVN